MLDVVRDHLAAIALYERAGWRRLGKVSVTWSNGRGADEVVYAAPDSPTPANPAPDNPAPDSPAPLR